MSGNFVEKVASTIKKYGLLALEKGKVVVGLSGGPDSVALLDVLLQLRYDIVAAHCNFHLRGEESDRDMAFVESFCRDRGVVLETISFDVEKRRQTTGESVEMACRELRYEWFDRLVKKYNAQTLVTGHHRDDNIETMMLNLLRSTGLRGAAGIKPAADRRVSPLIECSCSEIMDYLDNRRLAYVIDHTNNENEYRRNKVRNVVLPAIESQFPDARKSLGDSIVNLGDDLSLLDEAVRQWRERYMPDGETLNIEWVKSENRCPGALVYRLLEPYGFNREQTNSIVLNCNSGSRYESREYEAVVSRGVVRICRLGDSAKKEPRLKMSLKDVAEFKPLKNADSATFDSSILDGNPVWEVREWRQGDRMKPFGMGDRSKKLSDIFNDAKADDKTKRSSIVVTRNGEIVWVAGLKQSNLFRVDADTKQVVIISLEQ